MKDDKTSKENIERKHGDNLEPIKKGVENEAFKKAFGEQESQDEELTVKDAVRAVNDIYAGYKKAYKSASKQDKAKILLIVLPLVITLILGVAGVIVANTGQILGLENIEFAGVIMIAAGFGGFFMTIILIAIIFRTKGS